MQIIHLESENVHLRAAIKKATIQLELLENTSDLFKESSLIKQQYEESLKKLRHLERERENLCNLLNDQQVENARKITALEALLVECRCRNRRCACATRGQQTILDQRSVGCVTDCCSSTSMDKCVGESNKSDCTLACGSQTEELPSVNITKQENWCDCITDSGTSLKAEETKLEEVVHGLQSSVSKMIITECQMKEDKARIADLETQLSSAWRARDSEVQAARSCREQEIINLNKVIENLVKNLDSEKNRSDNLQKAVDMYHDTVDSIKDSENKFKEEVLGQKRTIQNLQDALLRTKQNLQEIQEKSNIECKEHSRLVEKLITIVTVAEKEIQAYVEQCEAFAMLVEKLRDENVQLEENLFYNHQDLEMYEMRLAKYQNLFNQADAQCGMLKKELQDMEAQKCEKDLFVQDLSENLADCQRELANLFTVLNDEKNEKEDQSEIIAGLHEQVMIVTSRLNCALHGLTREKAHNAKLTKSLKKSQCATSTVRNETILSHEKLQAAALKIASDDQKIGAFGAQIAEYKSIINNLEHEQCRLKQQLEMVKLQLDNRCSECAKFNEQIESLQNEHDSEIVTYQNSIFNMEMQCKKHCEELEMARQRLTEQSSIESLLKQDILDKETMYHTQINKYHSEQERLIDVVNNLEVQITHINSQLLEKERVLEMMQGNVSGQEKLREKQDENICLKNEINTLLETQAMLKSDNEKMQMQLAHMRASMAASDEKHKLIIAELEACLNDLHNDKDFLVRKNEQLMTKVHSLQELFNNKADSLGALELELSEAKFTRDSLCNESKQVIDHVKCWLEEQRKINMELNLRIKHKNDVICKLKQDKRSISSKLKQLTSSNMNTSKTVTSCTAYPRNANQQYSMQVLHSPPPPRRGWSLGSVDSAPCSLIDDSDWEADNVDDQCPQVWINRVETLTEELQRSNRYWKTKMSENPEYSVSRDK